MIQIGIIRKLECAFLFVFHSNYGSICVICVIKRDIGRKSGFFHTSFAFNAPVQGVPVGILPSRLVRKN